MHAVGQQYHLTRERVRQITGRVVRQMEPLAERKLTTLPRLLELIKALAPASADRIELVLRDEGLGDDRIEGVLNAAKQFNRPGKFIRTIEEYGARFVILPDMEGCVEKIISRAQKLTGHLGLINVEQLFDLLPGIPRTAAVPFIRDVISLRGDAVWLDEDREWFWLRAAPRNRLITCLSKIMTMYASSTLADIRTGVNRYFRKGKSNPPQLTAPDEVLTAFIHSWGQLTCSPAGIVRKTDAFEPLIEPLEMEEALALFILNRPERCAREREMENTLVPLVDGKPHPRKYNFSIALNYSPLIKKGEKRGEYVPTGTL